MKVPLDYENVAAGTTNIAFIKWTSQSENATNQDILLNPGGPGGSGVSFLLRNYRLLQEQLGAEHNLVGFDPRGVRNSGPDLSCFPGESNTERLYSRDLNEAVDVSNPESLRELYAKAGAWGQWCSNAHRNSDAKYANTVATAIDMLRYTELLAKENGQDPHESQLWYSGLSYGTVLGSTFAAMYPDRVGRMILDGVVDGEDYFLGAWGSNLPDADEAFSYFFQACYQVGQELCDFWAASPSAIQARFEAVVDKLSLHPIPVADRQTPAIITISDLKNSIAQAPYDPLTYFPELASMLVDLESDPAPLAARLMGIGLRNDNCSKDDIRPERYEPRQIIACNDAAGRFNLSNYNLFVSHVDSVVNQSHYMGEAWISGTSVMCRSLDIRPPESQIFNDYPGARNTRNPILFVSTLLDPVTPLRAARKMRARFGGAGLLVQNSVGHASLSVKSSCTFGHLSEYLRTGALPPEGTVCADVDSFPFIHSSAFSISSLQPWRQRRFL